MPSLTDQTLPNRIDGGGTTMQFGATSGVDTSDGERLAFNGDIYVQLFEGFQNRIEFPTGPTGTNKGWDVRMDALWPTALPASTRRLVDGEFGADLLSDGKVKVFFKRGLGTVSKGYIATTSNANILGPYVGTRRHLRMVLDPVAETISWYQRASGSLLSSDVGWTLIETKAYDIGVIESSNYSANSINDTGQQILPNSAYPTKAYARRGLNIATALILEDGLVLPGTTGNYAGTPDSAATSVTGDVDLRVLTEVRPDPANSQALASKWTAVGNNRSFIFYLLSTGELRLSVSTSGSASTGTPTSTTAVDSAATGYRVTREGSSGDVTFYQELAGAWVQLGTVVSGPSGDLYDSSTGFEVGGFAAATAAQTQGPIFSAELRDGIDGTIVASPDFAAQKIGSTKFTDAQSNAWTVNSSASGSDTNDPVFLPHSDSDHYAYFPGTGSLTDWVGTVATLGDYEHTRLTWEGKIHGTLGSAREIGGQPGFFLYTDASGNLRAWVNTVAGGDFLSFGAHGMSAETRYFIRMTRTKSTGVTLAERSTDGLSWATVGSATSRVGSAVTPNSTVFRAGNGAIGIGNVAPHSCMSIELGEAGASPLVRFDLSDDINTSGNPNAGQSSFTATTGQTVTVNRSTTGLKTAVVTRPIMLFNGVDHYMQLPASDTPTFTATTGKHTVVVAFRRHGTGAAGRRLWSSDNANDGASIRITSAGTAQVSVGGASSLVNDTSLPVVDGALSVVALVFDTGTLKGWLNGGGFTAGSSTAGVGTITHAAPRLGTQGAGVANQCDVSVFACLTFKDQALTATELDAIAADLLSNGTTPALSPIASTKALSVGSSIVPSQVSAYSARDITSTTQQTLPNRADSSLATAQRGSTVGSDTNDPLFLPHTGSNYVYFPGVTGNYATVPDAPALDIAGDFEVLARVRYDNWDAALPALDGIVARFDGPSGAGRSWFIRRFTSTRIDVGISVAGSPLTSTFTHSAGIFSGWVWLRMRFDSDNGASGYTVSLDYSLADSDTEPTTWTAVAAPVATAGAGSVDSSSYPLVLGSDATASRAGKHSIRRLIYRPTGGASVVDISVPSNINTSGNPNAGQSSFTATTGQTVTVNRSATGLKTAVVTRPLMLLNGTDHYMQLPASDTPTFTKTTGKHSFAVAGRIHSLAPSAFANLLYGLSGSSNGVVIYTAESAKTFRFLVGDGTGVINTTSGAESSWKPGVAFVVFGVVDNGTSLVELHHADGTKSSSSTADITTLASNPTFAAQMQWGTSLSGNASEGLGMVVAKETAWSADQRADIAAQLLAGTDDSPHLSAKAPKLSLYGARGSYDSGAWAEKFEPSTQVDLGDTDASQFTVGDANIIRAASNSGYKPALVTSPTWVLDGIDDYGDLPPGTSPDFTKSFTILSVIRVFSPSSSLTFGRTFSNRAGGSGAGFEMYAYINDTDGGLRARSVVTDGTNSIANSPSPVIGYGKLAVIGGRYDQSADTFQSFQFDISSGLNKSSLDSLASVTGSRVGPGNPNFGRASGGGTCLFGEAPLPLMLLDSVVSDADLNILCPQLLSRSYS